MKYCLTFQCQPQPSYNASGYSLSCYTNVALPVLPIHVKCSNVIRGKVTYVGYGNSVLQKNELINCLFILILFQIIVENLFLICSLFLMQHLGKYFKQSAKALEQQVAREARFYGALIR